MDWNYLGSCEYPIDGTETKCGEPAIAKMVWDTGNTKLVCSKHLQHTLLTEAEAHLAEVEIEEECIDEG